jgi:cysteine desulfurase
MTIYFDHNATTNIDIDALQEIIKISQKPLNNSSVHSFGREADSVARKTKEEIFQKLNANNHEIIFTSGGTEANNLIIQNFKNKIIITSDLEHSSVLKTANEVAKEVILLEFDKNGIINIDNFIKRICKIKEKGFLVSVLLAHNEIGTIEDIKKLAEITHQYGGFFHSDIIQAVGKIVVDIDDLNIDFASISGHKFGAPQGIGCVIKLKNFKLNPIIFGGGQEKNQRSGTSNIAGISALKKTFEKLDHKIQIYQSKVKNLRNYLEEKLKESFGDKIIIVGADAARLPNTTLLCAKNIDNDSQLIFFDMNGICLSKGSACSSGSSRKSLLLHKILGAEFAKYVIRISLGETNSTEEIDEFLKLYNFFFIKS